MEWIPSISTTAAFAIVLWFARKLIATRLTKSVQHEFDTKLALIQDDLRTKETEISVLRSGAMTAMASRQVALDKRKFDAIDQLWSVFIALGPAKWILASLSGFDLDKVFARAPHDAKLREVFSIMGKGFDETKIDFTASEKARPFVSPMAWALFSAYQAIVMQAVAKQRLIQIGFGDAKLLDTNRTKKLIKTALPAYESYIEEHGDRGYHLLLDILESNLLDEFRKMMAGEADDKETVERAAKIVEAANSVISSTRQDNLSMQTGI